MYTIVLLSSSVMMTRDNNNNIANFVFELLFAQHKSHSSYEFRKSTIIVWPQVQIPSTISRLFSIVICKYIVKMRKKAMNGPIKKQLKLGRLGSFINSLIFRPWIRPKNPWPKDLSHHHAVGCNFKETACLRLPWPLLQL